MMALGVASGAGFTLTAYLLCGVPVDAYASIMIGIVGKVLMFWLMHLALVVSLLYNVRAFYQLYLWPRERYEGIPEFLGTYCEHYFVAGAVLGVVLVLFLFGVHPPESLFPASWFPVT